MKFSLKKERSLQSLLNDYKRIVSDFGDINKSSYLNEILINEYDTFIGFKE